MGNGSSISFWHDRWHGDTPFKILFDRFSALDLVNECSVADRVVDGEWFGFLIREPRGGNKMQQYEVLREVVGQVDLVDRKNGWVWAHEGDGCFLVASACLFID